jgi:hypothetical protein
MLNVVKHLFRNAIMSRIIVMILNRFFAVAQNDNFLLEIKPDLALVVNVNVVRISDLKIYFFRGWFHRFRF